MGAWMPSLTVSFSIRSTLTMIRPSITMLSLSLRERMSMACRGLDEGVVKCGAGLDHQMGIVLSLQGGGLVLRREGGNETLHQVEGATEQEMILLGAFAHAQEQFIVFLDQSVDERAIGFR